MPDLKTILSTSSSLSLIMIILLVNKTTTLNQSWLLTVKTGVKIQKQALFWEHQPHQSHVKFNYYISLILCPFTSC